MPLSVEARSTGSRASIGAASRRILAGVLRTPPRVGAARPPAESVAGVLDRASLTNARRVATRGRCRLLRHRRIAAMGVHPAALGQQPARSASPRGLPASRYHQAAAGGQQLYSLMRYSRPFVHGHVDAVVTTPRVRRPASRRGRQRCRRPARQYSSFRDCPRGDHRRANMLCVGHRCKSDPARAAWTSKVCPAVCRLLEWTAPGLRPPPSRRPPPGLSLRRSTACLRATTTSRSRHGQQRHAGITDLPAVTPVQAHMPVYLQPEHHPWPDGVGVTLALRRSAGHPAASTSIRTSPGRAERRQFHEPITSGRRARYADRSDHSVTDRRG